VNPHDIRYDATRWLARSGLWLIPTTAIRRAASNRLIIDASSSPHGLGIGHASSTMIASVFAGFAVARFLC
jgi:hypothetical protein